MSGRNEGNIETKTEPMTPNKPGGGQNSNRGRGGIRGGGRGGMSRFGGPQNRDQSMNDGPKPQMGQGGPRRGGPSSRGGAPRNGDAPRTLEDRIQERLNSIGGPAYELPTVDIGEKKFSGRNRLYIGNLSNDITEEEVTEMFKPFGESSELFINKEKNFGFIRLDYRNNAEKAKRELDGTVRKGRTLKVRFAPNGATLKVKNLTPFVTNELLHVAFSVFGEVERCVVITDDHGKSTGEGLIEFARKPSAMTALRHCTEGCFFLTSSLRPVIAEMYEQMDLVDGFPEKTINRKSSDFHQARESGPRFASVGSFEYDYGCRWKQLYELYKQKETSLKQELQLEEDKLEAQMQLAKFESETEMLREQLRMREMDRERQKREWEERERAAEEARVRNEQMMRRQEEDLQLRMHHKDEDVRRRQQENSLYLQANQLTTLLDQQEQAMQSYGEDSGPVGNDYDNLGPDGPPMDPKSFMNQYDRGNRGYESRDRPWHRNDRRDDFQNKRRRY